LDGKAFQDLRGAAGAATEGLRQLRGGAVLDQLRLVTGRRRRFRGGKADAGDHLGEPADPVVELAELVI
jgi:hypothetical protein